jgi:hypothetical protein
MDELLRRNTSTICRDLRGVMFILFPSQGIGAW